jgi:hypothetical protein
LFIALRRAYLRNTRITPALLREWKIKVASSTSVVRKFYIVEMAALDALPQYPPDLDKWIIPKDELVLPADIYSDRTLKIDDGYDRANLNVLGVLHIECAAQIEPGTALPGIARPLQWLHSTLASGGTRRLCSANSSAVAAKAAEQSAARCRAGSSAAAAGPGAERCRCAA